MAWFALMSIWSRRIDAHPSEVVALYEEESGSTLNPTTVDLTCLGSVAQMGHWMGYWLASDAHRARQSGGGGRAAAQLAWWIDRARAALERDGAPSTVR